MAPEFRWSALIGAGVDDESWQQWHPRGPAGPRGCRGPANSSDGTWTSTGSLTELGNATFKL
ncbi:MAG TPA: hypothetical protein VE485_09065 [Mycobacterium sp.]|nr:hypothetical protein [Mycobacterium sp.]